jgi:hypothetical protein
VDFISGLKYTSTRPSFSNEKTGALTDVYGGGGSSPSP